MRGNPFLAHGHKKDLPHFTCIFYLLKYVVKIFLVSAILHRISLQRLLPKSYFKVSTFQPNFLCSSSFKGKRPSDFLNKQTNEGPSATRAYLHFWSKMNQVFITRLTPF